MTQPNVALALKRELIECAIARHWPDVDLILEDTGVTRADLRTCIQRMKLLNSQPDVPGGKRPPMPVPFDALLKAHAAYQRGERTPEVLAGQRGYDRQRKRTRYHALKQGQRHVERALAEQDMVLIDRIYEPMLTEWQRTA